MAQIIHGDKWPHSWGIYIIKDKQDLGNIQNKTWGTFKAVSETILGSILDHPGIQEGSPVKSVESSRPGFNQWVNEKLCAIEL